MHGADFVDTNIWIYAHLRKPNDTHHDMALHLVETLEDIVISPQVAMEYYSVMLRSGQNDEWIQKNLGVMLDYVRMQTINESILRRTWEIRKRYGFSIWDSQIVAAAMEAACRKIYTEDLQHGQNIESLAIVNPFQG